MSLRIRSGGRQREGRRDGDEGEWVAGDDYMSRLIKLIPAEAVTVYPLLVKGAEDAVCTEARLAGSACTPFFSPFSQPAAEVTGGALVSPFAWLPVAVAWAVLALVVIIRWRATMDERGRPQWGAIAIASISFVLWVAAINGNFGIFQLLSPGERLSASGEIEKFIAFALTIFWTILIPAFYRPDH